MDFGHNHDLLLAILATQMGFLTDDQFRVAIEEWNRNRQRRMFDVLLSQSSVARERLDILQALSETLLIKHVGDLPASLQALSLSDSVVKLVNEQTDSLVPPTISKKPLATDPTVAGNESTSSRSTTRHLSFDSGRFSIIRPHARGGLGEVFVAFDHELNRQVALKEIQGQHAYDEDSRQRFLIEAEITGGLEHPGIVPVYGLGTYQDGRPFYAMKFIKGESLADATNAFHHNHSDHTAADYRSADFRRLLQRLIDVCNAVAYAHARGILHRDLKPGNIMLGKYGETLVVDWGLAKAMDRPAVESAASALEETLRPSSGSWSSRTSLGQMIGTIGYMSPEAALGQVDSLGVASDVFCLGATLYFVLTGRAPYQSATTAGTVDAARCVRFPSPRQIVQHVPKRLEAICLMAMAREPSDRYATANDFSKDLEQWLADEPIAALRDPVSERLGRWFRRHRWFAATVGVFGCIMLLISFAFAWTVSQANTDLQVALQKADQATMAATQNAKTARDISMNIINVSERFLSQESQQLGLRETLIDDVYELFRKAHEQNPDDREVAIQFAGAARNASKIKYLSKKYADALRLIGESIDVQLAMAPTDKLALDQLASSYREQGSMFKSQGNLKEAANSMGLAASTMEIIRQRFDVDSGYMRGMAALDIERLGLSNDMLDYQTSYELATSAETSMLKLTADKNVDDISYTLANMASYRRGQALFALGKTEEGSRVYEDAIERGKRWAEMISSKNYRPSFARLYLYYAEDLSEQDAPPDRAMEIAAEAERLYGLLFEVEKDVEYQYYLACISRTQAVLHQRRQQFDEAEQLFNQSILAFEDVIAKNPVANKLSVFANVMQLKSHLLEEMKNRAAAADTMRAAVELTQRALALSPDSTSLKQDLAEFEQRVTELSN